MSDNIRIYDKKSVISFSKTRDSYGELSNFNPNFPLSIPTKGGLVEVDSSETFYQADKFRDHPDIQRSLIQAAWSHKNHPRGGKDFAWSKSNHVSEDWQKGRSVKSMRYILRMKLAQNHELISGLLKKSEDKEIVEFSTKDDFWGAKPFGPDKLKGMNILGRLWMEIRRELSLDPSFCKFKVAPYDTSLNGSALAPWIREARVLNARDVGTDVKDAVYVGRPSKWGNPIKLASESQREQVIDEYLEYLRDQPQLVDDMRRELAGKDLICWCAPRTCHADVIKHVASGNPVPDDFSMIVKKDAPLKLEEPQGSLFDM